MTFYNKIKWILGILMVFVLIITTNLVDRNNFIRVRDSVVTIYEDRLIANDLIFQMCRAIQEKEVALAVSDSIFFSERNSDINEEIRRSISDFAQTRLTVKESTVFNDLKSNYDRIRTAEGAFVQSGYRKSSELATHISGFKENLYDLSQIQLHEGARQMSISKRALDTVELFTQIEIYLLVFLAVIIQIIVMYKPKDSAA